MLQRDLPWAYAAMCAALGAREVLIEVDGEATTVVCDGEAARLVETGTAPAVRCRTTRAAILELVDAKATLAEAVTDERVWLQGSVDDLLAFHDGLMAYLGGAVRSPGFTWLLREFRGASSLAEASG
jgi:hypothetical protein